MPDSKSVTVIAHRRPDYLRQALEALTRCRGIENYKVIVSIDGPSDDRLVQTCTSTCIGWAPRSYRLLLHSYNLGVNYHPLIAHTHAFANSNFNVVVEDDCVLSPDALELADWYYAHHRSDYAALCLHSSSHSPDRPLDMIEQPHFCCWGWATTKEMWEAYFKPEWNHKHWEHPTGWDWSCNMTVQRHSLNCLQPVLSRCKNIGRENGVYETPEHWDSWSPQLVQSDGSFGNQFGVTDRNTPTPQHWVLSEMQKEMENCTRFIRT